MNLFKYISLFLFLSCLIACNNKTNNKVEVVQDPVAQLDTLDKGDLVLIFHQPTDKQFDKIYTALQTHKILDAIVEDFNQTLALPNDIEIHFDECQENNAFYSPETKQVTVCYELIKNYVDKSDLEISFEQKIEEATAFTMLHELGHALVDQLGIPITGKEENAVDEFAMMMLLDSQNGAAVDLALEGVLQFYYDSLDEESVDYSDEHAPSLERYFDLLSIYYGADPENNKDYVGQESWQLTEARSEQSTDEYTKKRAAWDILLAEHYKR